MGVYLIKIVPAQDVYFPPTPYRVNDRLHFTLCRTCSEELNKEECMHSPEERALTVAWTSVDLYSALDFDYKLDEVYEVWQYGSYAQYVPEGLAESELPRNTATRETEKDYDKIRQPDNVYPQGLFTRYVKAFYKNKIEASGYPSHIDAEPSQQMKQALKEQYAADIFEFDGVEIDPTKLEKKNPGARAVAKLSLNSLFGKFAQVFSIDFDKLKK